LCFLLLIGNVKKVRWKERERERRRGGREDRATFVYVEMLANSFIIL
jgi:hypothetical protein